MRSVHVDSTSARIEHGTHPTDSEQCSLTSCRDERLHFTMLSCGPGTRGAATASCRIRVPTRVFANCAQRINNPRRFAAAAAATPAHQPSSESTGAWPGLVTAAVTVARAQAPCCHGAADRDWQPRHHDTGAECGPGSNQVINNLNLPVD